MNFARCKSIRKRLLKVIHTKSPGKRVPTSRVSPKSGGLIGPYTRYPLAYRLPYRLQAVSCQSDHPPGPPQLGTHTGRRPKSDTSQLGSLLLLQQQYGLRNGSRLAGCTVKSKAGTIYSEYLLHHSRSSKANAKSVNCHSKGD